MWRSTRRRGDGGFTLVEIMVSLTILGLIAAATTPLLVGASRAALAAQQHTQAKNLGQRVVDGMRNLPFHVDKRNGDYRDVFDTYFPNLTAAASATAAGYVAPTSTARSVDEPATGAFYRHVVATVPQFSRFTQTVLTQFLDANRDPVTPPAGYDNAAASAGTDALPSAFAGVTVITSWNEYGTPRRHVLRTLLADNAPPQPLITTQARATALQIESTLAGNRLALETGLLNVDGALSTGSLAAYQARAATLEHSGSAYEEGASVVRSVQTSDLAEALPTEKSRVSIGAGNCAESDLVCVTKSQTANAAVELRASGLPKVGSVSSPVWTSLRSRGTEPYRNLAFSNAAASLLRPELRLRTGFPLVRLRDEIQPCVSGAADSVLCVTGYATASASPSASVAAAASVRAATIELFPTDFVTPEGQGLVRIIHNAASTISCSTSAAAATASYDVTVQYWAYDEVLQSSGYRSVRLRASDATDLLAAVPLATKVEPSGLTIGHYVQKWGGRPGVASSHTTGRTSTTNVPGIVSISTMPTTTEVFSGINLTVGRLSCTAEDGR